MSAKSDNNPGKLKLKYKSIEQLLKDYDPSKIENRLPSVLFTGPNSLYHYRIPKVDYKHEIGIGEPSSLRTLDISYLNRGKSVGLNRRHNIPGEIGWSAHYFRDFLNRDSTFFIPR